MHVYDSISFSFNGFDWVRFFLSRLRAARLPLLGRPSWVPFPQIPSPLDRRTLHLGDTFACRTWLRIGRAAARSVPAHWLEIRSGGRGPKPDERPTARAAGVGGSPPERSRPRVARRGHHSLPVPRRSSGERAVP